MNKKKVSIIIPVYNSEKTIKKTIDSVVNQTYDELEIIIINDGSTDNTAKIINEIDDKRLKQFVICNSGVSNARNVGIDKATGEFLMFVDADDYLDLNAVEILIEIMNENDVDIIRFNAFTENENNKLKRLEYPIENNLIIDTKNDFGKQEIFKIYNDEKCAIRGYCWLLFMKNQNIKLFNKELAYVEDKLFCLENMLDNKKVLFVNNCLYYYLFNENSKTKDINKFIENIQDILKSKKYFIELQESYNFNKKDLIEINYMLLISYRIDYYIKFCNYRKTKSVIKQCLNLLNFDLLAKHNINKFKKIQFELLKIKLYFLYYLITKIKVNLHG